VRYLKDCMYVLVKGQGECLSQILYMHLFLVPSHCLEITAHFSDKQQSKNNSPKKDLSFL